MTRFEQFRRLNAKALEQWPEVAAVSRSAFNKIRARGDMNVETLARLVRAASLLLGRDVRAAELVDLGEDEPAAVRGQFDRPRPRKAYDTRADQLLARLGVPATLLARTARLTRPTVRNIQREKGTRRASNLAAVVRALRQLTGVPVRATELCDVGEPE